MKTIKPIIIMMLLTVLISLDSCGPVIVSSRYNHPTPPWFYPNRVINLRYVYFPDYLVYYDITLDNYIYLNNGVWITVKVLPPRFNSVNFKHEKHIRVNNYFDDDIKVYHNNYMKANDRRTSKDEETSKRRRTN